MDTDGSHEKSECTCCAEILFPKVPEAIRFGGSGDHISTAQDSTEAKKQSVIVENI